MLKEIILTFSDNINKTNAEKMSAYMKGHFEFFGVKSPLRKTLSKPFFVKSKDLSKIDLIKLVNDLWTQPQRELHYLGQELAYYNLKTTKRKTKWNIKDIDFLERLVIHNSWWDTIDFVAPKLMGDYFQSFPEQIDTYTLKWLNSGNIWLVRCAILFQLKYKDKTDLELLYKIILHCCNTNEFFINKAIGWVLRENSKRIPNEIKAFIDFHKNELSSLSKREGLRLIK